MQSEGPVIDIVPDRHPDVCALHRGLLSVAVAPYLLVRILPAASVRQGLAYNSVVHDDIAYAAMTEHRNWALVTASLFVILALWPWGR